MPPVALISLYDEFCIGMRYVASTLTEKGYPSTVINFKQYAKQERATAPRDLNEGYLIEICPRGDVYLDYSTPITDEEFDHLFQLLEAEKFLFVGLSVPSYHKGVAKQITDKIHERFGLPVVWGGVHPTIAPDESIEWTDMICLGEGEEAVLELANLLAEGKSWRDAEIEGMWIRQEDGSVKKNPNRLPPDDLNGLPHPQHDRTREYLIENNRVYHQEPLTFSQIHWNYKAITGRGCPYICSFCVWSTLKRDYDGMKKLRRRSPQNALEELKRALDHNPSIEMIEFEDDIFTVQKGWLEEFVPLYKKHINKPFWCYTYPAFVNDENLSLLKEMGIAYITMGVQSGSDRINYEVYKRRTERKRVLEAMNLIAKYDILANYDIISNNPYETDEDRMETLTLITQIPGRFNLHLGKLAFFPGTTITVRALEEGKIKDIDEKTYRFWNALYLMAKLRLASEEQLVDLTKDEHLRNNPSILWSMLERFEDHRELQHRHVMLNRRADELQSKLDHMQGEYDRLAGRRVVKVGTKLADSIKHLVPAS